MPNWLRIVFAIMFVGILILAGLGYFAYHWIKQEAPNFSKRAKATQADARRFAQGKTSNDCVEEGLRRAKLNHDFYSLVEGRLFVSQCLNAATPSPGFCEAVPTGIIDAANWTNQQCAKHDMAGDQACTGVYQAVMQHCKVSGGR